MAKGTVSVRRTVVCPADVQIQDTVQTAIETRDVQTEAIILTDNVHIHTEIYSRTHLSSETNDGMPCPAFEHHDEDYMILHSSRSKNVVTECPDIGEHSSAEDKQRQVSKKAVDSPSEGPQKDSWDEGSRLLSETKKYLGTRRQICHPDCPNLHISRSTQFEQANEAGSSSDRNDTFTATQTDKVSTTATNLATIPEEESVHSTGGSEPNISAPVASNPTQNAENDQPMASVTEEQGDEQLVHENEEDYEYTEEPYDQQVETDQEEERENTAEKGTVVPTESILETTPPKRQKRSMEPSKWKSGAWIKSPSPTRFVEAETRSCARLIRSSSSQLNRGERCETGRTSSIRCIASSNRFCGEESTRRSGAEQFCPADYCSSKSSSTFCRPREPFTCDLLRGINNAKRHSPAVEPFESCARSRSDRNGAYNRYYSNFNETFSGSNDCRYPRDRASHGAYTSQYTARTMINYCTPSYCYSVNSWR